MNDRNGFVFYRSFLEAIRLVQDERDRIVLYEAVFDYALDGKEPDFEGYMMSLFVLIKPQIDANNRKRENGKRGSVYGNMGGRPVQRPIYSNTETPKKRQDNPTETPTKPQQNGTETPKEKDKEKDKAKEKEKVKDKEKVNTNPPNPPLGDNAADAACYRELKQRICRLFNRRETTAWTAKETAQLKIISNRKDVIDEIAEIETLYNSGYKYRRHDIITFLNNFGVELDRAHNEQQTYVPDKMSRATYAGDENRGRENYNGF